MEEAAGALASGGRCVLLLGGDALRRGPHPPCHPARVHAEMFPARQERGSGVPAVERPAYRADAVAAQLDGAEYLVPAGARPPVAFFAYPGEPGDLRPPGCATVVPTEDGDDVADALERPAERVGAAREPAPGPSAMLTSR
ncbi:hypothetical protein GCM10023259_017230 [Thermocatellispora tengchongensis]